MLPETSTIGQLSRSHVSATAIDPGRARFPGGMPLRRGPGDPK
jgi:hypothetical protein